MYKRFNSDIQYICFILNVSKLQFFFGVYIFCHEEGLTETFCNLYDFATTKNNLEYLRVFKDFLLGPKMGKIVLDLVKGNIKKI